MTKRKSSKPGPVERVLSFLSSYTLSGVLFILLLLITFLGTLDQVENGLYETQQKYFNSIFVIHKFFGVIPAVLPGAYLLIALLGVNLICGGVLRMRKGWGQVGILIVHVGVIVMMAGSLVTRHMSIDGHLTLYENEQSNEFLSYHEWEITLTEGEAEGEARQYVIPGERFSDLPDGQTVTFESGDLPFALTVNRFFENATLSVGQGTPGAVETISAGGMVLSKLPREPKNERNIAGALVEMTDPASNRTEKAVLWGMTGRPAAFVAGETPWLIQLQRRRWVLPFTIVLDKFTRELHPGTSMPRVFMSDIRKIEDGSEQVIHISMNEPLRHKGYTFFQSSWGPQNAGPGERLFSTFSVVRNPADQFPLYACIIITFGLLLHFMIKLTRYLRAARRTRT